MVVGKRPQIIAEVKTESPFGWRSDRTWDQLFALAESVGDMLSIHTDPRWGGSFDFITTARQRTNKPILAKGVHLYDADIVQAIERGADYALVVGRLPGVYLEQCLIEPYTLEELVGLPEGTRAVWNSRDLLTGGTKAETFDEARMIYSGWLCQASNIATIDDVNVRADAILVGTHLPEFAQSIRES